MTRSYTAPTTGRTVVGLLFALVAVAGLLAAILGARVFDPEPVAAADAAFRIFGAVLALGLGWGAAMTLTLDIEVSWSDREIRRITSRLGRSNVEALQLDGRGCVLLEETVLPSGSSSTIRFWETHYVHPDGKLALHKASGPAEGRAWCERMAADLGVPMVDATAGELDVRGAGQLDASIVERIDVDALAWPGSSSSARMTAAVADGRVRIDIDPKGFGTAAVVCLGLLAAAAWAAQRMVATLPEEFTIWTWICLPLFALVIVLLGSAGCFGLHHALFGREHIEVDVCGVRRGKEFFAAATIEQVVLGADGGSVELRSDERRMSLGSSLEPFEAEHLRDMVLLALAGRAPAA